MTYLVPITDATVYHLEAGWTVQAYDAQGREYTLANVALPLWSAEALLAKVKARGSVDVDLWLCRAPYGTDAWLLDGCEDRWIEDERSGYL